MTGKTDETCKARTTATTTPSQAPGAFCEVNFHRRILILSRAETPQLLNIGLADAICKSTSKLKRKLLVIN
jgi:hypothetical protein